MSRLARFSLPALEARRDAEVIVSIRQEARLDHAQRLEPDAIGRWKATLAERAMPARPPRAQVIRLLATSH
jgi:hypothetical protein